MERWSTERVTQAAPDAASAKAGAKLAVPATWSETGCTDTLLWGKCQGSGSKPYQTVVDTAAVAYKCSCPSRKFPCKHALGLLHLWARGEVADTDAPADFAAEWAEKRHAREESKAEKAAQKDAPPTAAQLAAAEKRARARDEKVSDGLDELQRWMLDVVGQGVAAQGPGFRAEVERMAARMVDAQAPGIAERLRQPISVGANDHEGLTRWVTRTLGPIHLLVRAWQRRDELPDDLVATVRTHLGFTTGTDEVLARPGVPDQWAVVGFYDHLDRQLTSRRVWLRGLTTQRWAMVLTHTPRSVAPDASLMPGMVVEGSMHYFPGRPELRGVLAPGFREVPDADPTRLAGGDVVTALREFGEAQALDPWLAYWPAAIRGHLELMQNGTAGPLTSADGVMFATVPRRALWPLLTLADTDRVLFGEVHRGWGPPGDGLQFTPRAALVEGRVEAL